MFSRAIALVFEALKCASKQLLQVLDRSYVMSEKKEKEEEEKLGSEEKEDIYMLWSNYLSLWSNCSSLWSRLYVLRSNCSDDGADNILYGAIVPTLEQIIYAPEQLLWSFKQL